LKHDSQEKELELSNLSEKESQQISEQQVLRKTE